MLWVCRPERDDGFRGSPSDLELMEDIISIVVDGVEATF